MLKGCLRFFLGLILFLIFTGLAIYLSFPFHQVNTVLAREANSYLPARVMLTDLQFVSPLLVHTRLSYEHRGHNFSLPLGVRLSPSLAENRLRIFSLPKGKIDLEITGREGKFQGRGSNFSVGRFLPGQQGNIKYSTEGKLFPPAGEFEFNLQGVEFNSAAYLPPLLRNREVRRGKLKGNFTGEVVHLESISLYSQKIILEGRGKIRLKKPLSQSKINLNLEMKQPLQRKYDLETSLRKFM